MIRSKLVKVIAVASLGIATAFFSGCESMNSSATSSVIKSDFGKTPDGQAVELYTLRNAKGMEAQIMTYGGIVTSLRVPGKNSKLDDVVLGYDNLEGYLKSTPYFGALVGRYGNRIANGKFTLNGKKYTLAKNNGENSLHGGVKGFDKVVWKVVKATGNSLELQYTSKDGEEGFPGNLNVTALYTLTDDNGLRLDYTATTDKDTHCNLTQHSYFNFAGKGDVLNHVVTINADRFTPVDASLIPTGELRPVKGTPLDFTKPMPIGARIDDNDDQLKLGKGYDHTWVLNKRAPGTLTLAATVTEPTSGHESEMCTTEPAGELYAGNFLVESIPGQRGWTYQARNGFCFEPQHFPDSPNKPSFPTTVLKVGETYKNTIIFKFIR